MKKISPLCGDNCPNGRYLPLRGVNSTKWSKKAFLSERHFLLFSLRFGKFAVSALGAGRQLVARVKSYAGVAIGAAIFAASGFFAGLYDFFLHNFLLEILFLILFCSV